MTKIVRLEIRKFRGINELDIEFYPQNLICFIGRGDSGKTTVLEAIASVLSPSWNLVFHDTDFYECQHQSPIEIKASLIDFPSRLLSDDKYGLYTRAYRASDNKIIDDVVSYGQEEELVPLLTIKLKVDESLEPKWTVVNDRDQEEKQIGTSDRAALNCYLVSDYLDRHFSWNKGGPLYSLLKSSVSGGLVSDSNIIIDSLRQAKSKIDSHPFENLEKVTDAIKIQAAALGLNISDAKTTLDFKDFSIKDGRISLHENSVPFRLKGKGSKRLASFAIQSALVGSGGIMLVDEIEQGLEPDRVKQLVRTLNEQSSGQIFLTTHSREVITELCTKNLLLFLKDGLTSEIETRSLNRDDDGLQKAVRACPEAFFAKKVIVCEGATEIGVCRALDKWRGQEQKRPMSFKDCAYVDGTGSSLMERANRVQESGFTTALFCDSDRKDVNLEKINAKAKGVAIFDCEDELCLEAQVFSDLPWSAIQELIDYVLARHKNGDLIALRDSVKAKYSSGDHFPEDWQTRDTPEMRRALAKASTAKEREWFKTVEHGEKLGSVIFKYISQICEGKRLKSLFEGFSIWIDE